MPHTVKLSTFQGKWLTSVIPVPPTEASQPIPSWLTVAVQLTETGSPYRTTTLEGLNSMGHEAPTPAA